MKATVLQGNVFDLLPTIEKGSIAACVTSPPYWALRSYLPKGHPLKHLELGREPAPQEYVANQVRVMRLVRDCLAPYGTVWLNVGDTYTGYHGNSRTGDGQSPSDKPGYQENMRPSYPGNGNICLIPQRLAIALQEDGWIVRSVICWCLSQSTVLYAKTATTEGPMTIHDLVRLDPATVKLWTGEKWSQVCGWSETETAGNTYRFTLRSGETITCTGNHRWPLADGRIVRADELGAGDVLATTTLPEPAETEGDYLEDLAWFAGLYLAEGCVDGDCIRIYGHTKEVERHARAAHIANKYGGSATLHAEGDTATQRIHGRILVGAIEHFIAGHGAKGKHLNPRAWRSSNAVLRSLLEGYLAGDGHYDAENCRWRLTFCRNNALAQDFRVLAGRLGFKLTLNPTYSQMGGTRRFESYRGEIRFSTSNHHSEKSRTEIVRIDNGRGGTFYDIGIDDEPHVFALASGVLTHNSKPAPMPQSVAGWRWARCRAKVKTQADPSIADGYGVANRQARPQSGGFGNVPEEFQTLWQDCPGCRKCEKHNGYVLRKGSWRPTSSYEPILMLAKSSPYFCDGESVKMPPAASTIARDAYSRIIDDPDEQFAVAHDHETQCLTGANPRDVLRTPLEEMTKEELIALVQELSQDDNAQDIQTWAAEPLKEKHYAAFPTALVDFCLRAATSARGYCPACGMPWCRVLETPVIPEELRNRDAKMGFHTMAVNGGQKIQQWRDEHPTTTLDWRPSCSCDAGEPTRGLVLDPFAGSGRTAIAARRLGLDFVGCELNPDYADMATRILKDDAPLFS